MIRIPEGRSMDKSMDGSCIRDKTCFRGTVVIGMCGDIGKTVPHKIARLTHFRVSEGGVKACHHNLRIHIIQHNSFLLKFPRQKLISKEKDPFPRVIAFQIIYGRLTRCHNSAAVHKKPHACQLLHIIFRTL